MLQADEAALLIRADHLWRTVQGMLRITVGRGRARRPAGCVSGALLRAAGGRRLTGGLRATRMTWRNRFAPRSSGT